MKIRHVRVLQGPNVWAACPVLEVVLDFASSDADALSRAEALVAQARTLQNRAGTPVAFTAVGAMRNRLVSVAVEFVSAPLAREALEISCRLLASQAAEPTPDDMRRLKDFEYQQRIPPTVATTYDGAKKLGIPVAKLSAEYSGYLLLGHGSKQRRMRWSEPDAVSGVARLASTDKYLTNQLLRSIGVPVPRGRLIGKVEDAWPAALEVGLPVAVKPYNCDLQTGVSLDLQTQDRVEAAFQATVEHSSWALVEHFAPGVEHRVVVVGDRVVAVTRIEPPQVVGDGVSTVAQLVAAVNRETRRSGDDRSDAPLAPLKIDDVALAVLASQGFTLDSVPPAGLVTLVRRDPPYFKNGGTLSDLTDQIHPTTAAHCVAAAHMMQIPVAGLDVVALDISRPLEDQAGIIVEINSNPGFWLHLAPWADSPRPVGEEVVSWLFPAGDHGRIPVVALVEDDHGSVKNHLTALLSKAGLRVGCAGPLEMSAAGRRWPTPTAPALTPQTRAFVLFRDPTVDIALLETNPTELLDHGFANDRCDVAILASPLPAITTDDRGPAEFVKALANALPPTGAVVALAPWSFQELGIPATRGILVGSPEDAAALTVHVAAGGRTVSQRGRDIVLGQDGHASSLLGPSPTNFTPTETQNLLLALAAAWALGENPETMATYLRSIPQI